MRTDATVARAVLTHDPISRSALAVRIGMSPASLTRLTKPYVDRGILVELDDVVDGVGRPTRPLDVSDGVGTFLGVKLTGGEAHVVLTDVHAQPLGGIVSPLHSHTPSDVVDTIVDAVNELVGDGILPVGSGISVGGATDGSNVVWGAFLEWESVPLGELVSTATGLPTRVENDVVSLIEAERWFGVVRPRRTR